MGRCATGLCAAEDKHGALRHGLGLSLLILTPLVLLQAALAPVYVPLLLGQGWAEIAPVVSVLCLAALPTVIWSAVAAGSPTRRILARTWKSCSRPRTRSR